MCDSLRLPQSQKQISTHVMRGVRVRFSHLSENVTKDKGCWTMSSALHQSRYATEKTHWGASIWCVRRWPACSKDIRQQYPDHVSVTSPLQTSSKCALMIKILVRGPSCPAPVCRQTHDFLDALDVLRYFGQRRSSYTISLARFCVPCNCQKRDLVDSMFAGLRCSARWSTCMSSVILRKLSKRVQVYVMDLEAGVLLGI
jgi:hypothetical protein